MYVLCMVLAKCPHQHVIRPRAASTQTPPTKLTRTHTQGSRGKAIELPAFLGGPAASPEQLLIQWEVQSDQGTGQVLLLARAAHCMRRLSEARSGAAAGGAEFEVRGWCRAEGGVSAAAAWRAAAPRQLRC